MDAQTIARPRQLAVGAALAPVFAVAICTSAFLLFAIQPMFTKIALPLLGGAPNVWNTAMVFFQGALLLGYLYAHFLARRFSLRLQVLIHALVLFIGFVFLPIAAPAGWTPPAGSGQAFWLLGFMAVSIGAPFFALSANAPLLQNWFSKTNHKTADDPYYLYAASNVGSLCSLLAYPVLIEPNMGLVLQSNVWSIGYFILVASIMSAGLLAVLSGKNETASVAAAHETADSEEPAAPALKDKLMWIAFATVPSGLMLAVTTHLTTNVAPSPFLWIIPLSLYLLSFIIVFSALGEKVRAPLSRLAPFIIVAGVICAPSLHNNLLASSGLHLLMFFVATMVLHGELAARRPAAAHLTEFYLWMSFGGVLGGVFTALLSPMIFPGIWEYPILLVAAGALATFAACSGDRSSAADAQQNATVQRPQRAVLIVAGVAGLIGALSVVSHMAAGSTLGGRWKTVDLDRSFFGILSVQRYDADEGPLHVLRHGTVIHNMQLRTAEKTPLAYHGLTGPFGDVLAAQRAQKSEISVATIGLGAGALACHAAPGEQWRYYEIDPNVIRVAEDPALFSYLSACTPEAPVVAGDARLHMQAELEADAPKYDVLIIDAFSSDTIPSHLITREAVALYQARVKDDGLIIFHTSNKYLDISSVAIQSARAAGLDWRYVSADGPTDHPLSDYIFGIDAVLVGHADAVEKFAAFSQRDWAKSEPHRFVSAPWTDDYQNVIGALRAQKNKKSD